MRLSHPRRDLLARVLEVTLLHVRLGTDAELLARLGDLSTDVLPTSQTGRPSQPTSVRRGHDHLPDSSAEFPR